MTEVATIAPVRKTLSVECSPERAFEVFTGEVMSWWPIERFSIHEEKVRDVVLEPREGGEMYEVAESGKREHWARVVVFEPPRRLVLAWKVNPATDAPTEIEVTFTPEGQGTRVELEHRHLERHGQGWEGLRAGLDNADGWPLYLGRFGALIA
jgi:uncharacterized protein YndB with AHSA1/START domain